jgi:hypothetical protein
MTLHDAFLATVDFNSDDVSIYESLMCGMRSCELFRNTECWKCSIKECRLNELYVKYDNLIYG